MDDLIKLRQKKIRQKLRYLQYELMETKIIYKSSLRKFHQDFSQDISEQPKPEDKVDTKDPYEQIETEVSEDTMKKVYRKVANKVHPDKKGGDKEKFQLAATANKNKAKGGKPPKKAKNVKTKAESILREKLIAYLEQIKEKAKRDKC